MSRTEQLEQGLRRLVDSRMTAARNVANAAVRRDEQRALLDQAQSAYAQAFSAALGAGWTLQELRKVGLDEPERTTPKRKRRAADPTPTSATEQPT
jgi:hypothetical protein